MTDGPPAAATSARFVNLPLSPSKAKTTILSSSWNPTYSMSDIVHPPSPSAVGHARPQQSSPLINVYFRARPAATRPTRMGRRTHGMAYGVKKAETAGRCGRPRSSYLADPNASSTTSLRSAVHRSGTASSNPVRSSGESAANLTSYGLYDAVFTMRHFDPTAL